MTQSLQDHYAPNNSCFGCGPANPDGLGIKSFVDGDEIVCTWQPQTMHQAFPGVLNGGIIGALLDCHCNWAAAYHQMLAQGVAVPPCTVTAEYSIKLRRPIHRHKQSYTTYHPATTTPQRRQTNTWLNA